MTFAATLTLLTLTTCHAFSPSVAARHQLRRRATIVTSALVDEKVQIEAFEQRVLRLAPPTMPPLIEIARDGSMASGIVSDARPTGPAEPEMREEDMELLSSTLDWVQQYLIKVAESGGENDDTAMAVEGKKMLSIERFKVAQTSDDDGAFAALWGEIGALLAGGQPDTGALVLLPKYIGDVAAFTDSNCAPALEWLGRVPDIELRCFRASSGAPCPIVRVLHAPTPPLD